MMCILSIASSLLLGFGFSGSDKDRTALTLRAISMFCVFWFITFFIWWIEQTHYYLKLSKSKTKALECLSFLPIFNLVSIIRLSREITKLEFNSWLFNLFSKTNFENTANDYFTKKWYLNLATLIVMTPFLVLLWWPDGENIIDFYNKSNELHNNMWFEGFQFFTIQTNLLCFIYLLIFVINPRIKFFDNDSALICLLSYLFIVAITYDFVLLPTKGSSLNDWEAMKWIKTCWEHVLNPIMFITIGIYNLHYICRTNNKRLDYLTTLKFGMVIPSIYLSYVLVLPFVSYNSVYGSITNVNPDVITSSGKHGDWYKAFFIIGYWFVFIGIITMFWTIKYSFYSRQQSKLQSNI